MRSRAVITLMLLSILCGAAALRFYALDFGPGVLQARPDEPGVIMALRAIEDGEFSPSIVYGGAYHYPLYAFVRAWGVVSWSDSLGVQIDREPFSVHVAARAFSAVVSTLAVLLVYLTGTRLAGRTTGLVAAALLACSTIAVRDAHFAKADSAASCAAALVCLALVLPASRGSLVRTVAIGIAGGVALGTKYVVGVLPAVLAGFAISGKSGPRRLDLRSMFIGSVVICAVFLALNPFWITRTALARRFFVAVGHAQLGFPRQAWLAPYAETPLKYHARVSLWFGCGRLFALLTVPALATGLYRGWPSRLIALSILGIWAALLGNPLTLSRNFLPCIPGLCVLIALLLTETARIAASDPRRRTLLLTFAAMAVVAEPLSNAVSLVRLLGRTDTRTMAREWIDTHLPADARFASWGAPRASVDFGLPPLGAHAVRRIPPARWSKGAADFLVWHHHPIPYSSEPLPPEARGLRSLAVFDPFTAEPVSAVFEPADAFYLPLAGFDGIVRPGPRIEVFALPQPTR